MAHIKAYAQDIQNSLGWDIPPQDNMPKAILVFEWDINGEQYPSVKVYRADVEGMEKEYLPYAIYPDRFFEYDLPAIKRDQIGFDETWDNEKETIANAEP